MPEPLHLRPPRSAETLCGAPAKSVRTTRTVALATCQACFVAFQKAVDRAEMARMQRHLEELQRAGQLPDGWSLPPIVVPEPTEG